MFDAGRAQLERLTFRKTASNCLLFNLDTNHGDQPENAR
jgi:hypothetical protein